MTVYTMVYDFETVPDCNAGRKILGLKATCSDEEVVTALKARRLEQTQGQSDFLPHYLQRIVAISVVVRCNEWIKVWSLGENADEKNIIERFFAGIERYKPTLVSWNGSGFDLPVLHYRALFHGIVSKRYWENGEKESEYKWNNYLSRYHSRHTDLMDVLAAYQSRAYAPLNEISLILGFPGKMGMAGDLVWQKFQENELDSIRNYCETDVLNTYLVYLKFQTIRGQISPEESEQDILRLQNFLRQSEKPHLLEFLEIWQNEIQQN
jgi:3'-5' exonuclease